MARNKTRPRPKRAAPAESVARWSWDTPLMVGLLVLCGVVACYKLTSTDVWWHLKTGQLILQQGTIPRVDPFHTGFTPEPHPYVDLHWGFQVVAYAVYTLGGVPGLIWMKILLAVGAVALTLGIRVAGAPRWLHVAVWIPALFLLGGRLLLRPEIFTLSYLALYLLVLHHARRRAQWLWVLPVVQVLWVNMQGLFVLGPIVLGLYWVDLLLHRWTGRGVQEKLSKKDEARFRRHLVMATVGVAIACLANPYFVRGTVFPLELVGKLTGGHDLHSQHIGELRSPLQLGLGNFFVQVHLGLGALAVVTFVLNRRRFSVYLALLFVAFTVLGLQATRNSSYYAMAVVVVVTTNLGQVWTAAPSRSRSRRGQARWVPGAVRSGLGLVMAVGVWWVATDRFYDWVHEPRTFGIGKTPNWYADDAMQMIGRAGLVRRAMVVHLGQAAVYLWYHAPPGQVLMDPRLEVNPGALYEEYERLRTAINSDGDWSAALEQRGVELLVLDHHEKSAEANVLVSPDWRCVFYGPVASVFVPEATAGAGTPRVDFGRLHFGGPRLEGCPPRGAGAGRTGLLSRRVRRGTAGHQAWALYNLGQQILLRTRQRSDLLSQVALVCARRAMEESAERPGRAEAHYYAAGASVLDWGTWGGPREVGLLTMADPIALVPLAQTTCHLRRALSVDRWHFPSLLLLSNLLAAQRILDARLPVLDDLSHVGGGPYKGEREQAAAAAQTAARLRSQLAASPLPNGVRWRNVADLLARRDRLLRSGRVVGAIHVIDRAYTGGKMPWPVADHLARLHLLLGRPDQARAVYATRLQPGFSAARQQARIGTTWLAEACYAKAVDAYRAAVRLDPSLLEAQWGLGQALRQAGDAPGAAGHLQQALRCKPTAVQRAAIDFVLRQVRGYVK